MTENANILNKLLQQPYSTVDKQWVSDMLQSHPCFYLPAALLLKRNQEKLDSNTIKHMRSVVMMNCADRTAIVDFVDPYKAGWDAFYPKEEGKKAPTDQTIDDFIQQFGQNSTPEEDALLERLIFNPVPADYFSGTDEPIDPSAPLSLPPELRRDIASGKKPDIEKQAVDETSEQGEFSPQPDSPAATDRPVVPEAPNEHDTHTENNESGTEESLLTESLVKIFIKRHNYERALDIITRLSLNYPEKSVYFADQKRFLKKLIINQQYLNDKK